MNNKLDNINARYYDPRTGRFLSEDSIGLYSGDSNLYRYTSNNPSTNKDPTGHIWFGAVIGGVFGAVSGAYSAGEGNRVSGALIGAASGALAGTGIGGVFGASVISGLGEASLQAATTGEISGGAILLSMIGGGVGTSAGNLASKILQVPGKVIGNSLGNISKSKVTSNEIISSVVGGAVGGLFILKPIAQECK